MILPHCITMIDALIDLQKKYAIDQVIVVADSAMIDACNRAFMEKHGIHYIVGDRIKNLPRSIAQQLIDKENHRSITTHQETDVVFSYSSVTYENRKIICTYSSKRAAKDRAEREKLINALKLEVPKDCTPQGIINQYFK